MGLLERRVYFKEGDCAFNVLEVWLEDTVSTKRKFLEMILANRSKKYSKFFDKITEPKPLHQECLS